MATRDEIRAALISAVPETKSKLVTLYGFDVELRQPTFADILRSKQTDDAARRAAEMVVKYAYMPGTQDRVFDDSDLDSILKWPFGDDLMTLQTTIAELTGVNIAETEEEIAKNDTPEQH